MGAANIAGPAGPDLSPPRRADAAEVRRRIQAGEWVVDLRDRVAFAAGFVPGSFSFPLDGSFATYLGWVIPWNKPVTLLGETPRAGQRGAAGAGPDRDRPPCRLRDRASAGLGGPPGRWPRCGWPSSVTSPPPWRPAATTAWSFSTSAGAWNFRPVISPARRTFPFSELPDRPGDIPPGEVWVHCHSGYRSMVAASMLAARGRRVVSIDDEFGHAEAAGLALA